MSYSVQQVRATYECDACGEVAKFDADEAPEKPENWMSAQLHIYQFLCCPACVEKVSAVLFAKQRAEVAARDALIRDCTHTFIQRGFIQLCSKCGKPK